MSFNATHYLKHEIAISGISNMVFNGLIAWLLLRGKEPLAWLGKHSFVTDMIATSFLLTLIIAAIIIPVNRKKLRRSKVGVIQFSEKFWLQRLINSLPQSNKITAFIFAFSGILIAVPLPLLCFYLLGIESIAAETYAIFKGVWAGVLAAIIISPMVMFALRREQQHYSGAKTI
jgi:hypothetical protein